MKKYGIYIAIAILAGILAISVDRFFRPKPKPEYKEDLKKIEILEKKHQKSLDSLNKVVQGYREDSTKIEIKYEKVFTKPITNRIGDSLARAILRTVK